jgi:hypothetical protein
MKSPLSTSCRKADGWKLKNETTEDRNSKSDANDRLFKSDLRNDVRLRAEVDELTIISLPLLR